MYDLAHKCLISNQQCSIVRELGADKTAAHAHATSSWSAKLFGVVFPSDKPAVNAILAVLYISGPPNFLLALCPTNIDPSSLSIMVAFAVGGLMGDTLFHLLPEIFVGEDQHDRATFVLVEPNRNLLLGVAILVGFMTFVAMDKGLRIATGGHGHDHSHGHAHGQESSSSASDGGSSTSVAAKADADAVKARGKGKKEKQRSAHETNGKPVEAVKSGEINPSVKLGGYLNLMCVQTRTTPSLPPGG